MNKGDLTNNNDNKVHARKGKSLIEFNAKKNMFQILQKIQNLLFTVKISFFALCDSRWNGGSSSCTAKVRVIRIRLSFLT